MIFLPDIAQLVISGISLIYKLKKEKKHIINTKAKYQGDWSKLEWRNYYKHKRFKMEDINSSNLQNKDETLD